jgi:hypothetical protein
MAATKLVIVEVKKKKIKEVSAAFTGPSKEVF